LCYTRRSKIVSLCTVTHSIDKKMCTVTHSVDFVLLWVLPCVLCRALRWALPGVLRFVLVRLDCLRTLVGFLIVSKASLILLKEKVNKEKVPLHVRE
jgi:hypothetical protein